MISFRAIDGATFNRIDDAIAYESQRYASAQDKHRRGRGSTMIREAWVWVVDFKRIEQGD